MTVALYVHCLFARALHPFNVLNLRVPVQHPARRLAVHQYLYALVHYLYLVRCLLAHNHLSVLANHPQ